MSSVAVFKKWLPERIDAASFALLLLFLFPIGMTYVRHWASGIFVLLFFVATYYWIRYKTPHLIKEEKVLLWLYLAYFLVFILTSLVNGWDKEQTSWLALELRFLIFIPIYIMIRQLVPAQTALFSGMAVALVGTFIWGIYELSLSHDVQGIYGPLFMGPVTALLAMLLITYGIRHAQSYRGYILYSVLFLLGLFVVANTTARSAYVGILGAVFVLIIMLPNIKHRVMLFVMALVIGIAAISLSSLVEDRSEKAYNEFIAYMKEDHPEKSRVAATSVGTRLEMLRSLKFFLQDSPVFGVGRGNYQKSIAEYVAQGKLNSSVADHSHPHNLIAETLISRGILGLIVMLVLLYYPLWIYIKTRKQSANTAILGILHILLITIYSLTETATFIKGNFVALNLIFTAVLFSSHLRQIGKYA